MDTKSEKLAFKFQVVPLLASVAAAVVAALIGSRLSVQGTLVGAAATAIVAGVVTQFTTFGLQRTHAGLKLVVTLRAPSDDQEADAASAGTRAVVIEPAPGLVHPAGSPAKRGHVPRGVAIAGIGATAVVTFVAAVTVLTAVEATTGRSLDGKYTTTISGAARQDVTLPPATPRASATPTLPSASATPSQAAPAEPSVGPSPAPTTSTTDSTPSPQPTESSPSPAAPPAPAANG